MFGEMSIIEKIDNQNLYVPRNIHNRIFYSGTLFTHNDPQLNYYRNRRDIYTNICQYIYNPGRLLYEDFLKQIRESKFALDLNGVGDPNKLTFEIFSQGTLRIGEYNDLLWPFEEEFSEETIFKNADEFKIKITELMNNTVLYDKCIENQQKIYLKYFNIPWIKNYILQFI
jgi:hypothetical protein